MKNMKVNIQILEKGDRVITGEGYGTVIKNNIEEFDGKNYLKFWHEVTVQHDEGISANPSNEPRDMDADVPGLLKPGDEGYEKPKTGLSRI